MEDDKKQIAEECEKIALADLIMRSSKLVLWYEETWKLDNLANLKREFAYNFEKEPVELVNKESLRSYIPEMEIALDHIDKAIESLDKGMPDGFTFWETGCIPEFNPDFVLAGHSLVNSALSMKMRRYKFLIEDNLYILKS